MREDSEEELRTRVALAIPGISITKGSATKDALRDVKTNDVPLPFSDPNTTTFCES